MPVQGNRQRFLDLRKNKIDKTEHSLCEEKSNKIRYMDKEKEHIYNGTIKELAT